VSWALLIVEDDADIREELAGILTARGFHVFAAGNGVEALDLARQQGIKPSVILLDLVMPVMDGVALLECQHEVPLLDGVPVIVITAQATRVPRTLPPTVRAVLEKPLPLAQLIGFVQDVCSTMARSGAPRLAKGSGGLEAKEIAAPLSPAPPLDLDHVKEPHQEPRVDGAAQEGES